MTPCQADLALRREVAATTGQPMTPTPFDVLVEVTAGYRFRHAKEQATALCARCPIWFQCFRDNRDEQWVQAILAKGTLQNPNRHKEAVA